MIGIYSVWVTLVLSSGLALASYLGLLLKWPKVSYVSAVSNAMVLALFYLPSMVGFHYYIVNMFKMVPLILWLVILCRDDPSPDSTYQGLCLVFILQILTGGWHVLSGLASPYYDQLAFLSTILELAVISYGGYNARNRTNNSNNTCAGGPAVCSLWAKRNCKREA